MITVDGRNILDGEKSSGGCHEAGYVMTPPSCIGDNVITGWRKNSETVNNFVLAEPQYSYAVMTGSSEYEVGVIAVRFFSEFKLPTSDDFSKSPTRGGATRGMGTGYGRQSKFKTKSTYFNTNYLKPPITLVLRIAQENELIKGGCTLEYDPDVLIPGSNADPFPGSGVPAPDCYNPYN